MSEHKENNTVSEAEQTEETTVAPETGAEEQTEVSGEQTAPVDEQAEKLAAAEEKFLRLAAEYDNYRKRTAKEKEAIWTDAKAQAVTAFLPVYDNLERALKQETVDAAYAKGVEMTLKGLQDVLTGLGVEMIPALGESFDPNRHNAVMHVEDDSVGENTVVEVFQQGFICGEKVIRFSMVKVAN
ncbi:MAG: nucleotide exchange factor GrpE [Oscillospiraceae bacterium]|nr:nucleotide exchange factor GrpE [Oscillospiraceae bacterium]